MVKYENECCGCATSGYPCIGDSCKNRNVPHFYCDKCGEEHKLYDFEGKQLCIYCVADLLDVVEGSN